VATATSDKDVDRALAVVLAEYQYVAQNILMYRHLETFVLAGTGLVASGALAAFAALTTGEHPSPSKAGIVLTAAAWGPALLLLVEITALTRVLRASRYIARQLRPIAVELAHRDDVLQWEIGRSKPLIDELASSSFFRRLVRVFLSSVGTPLIPGATAAALAISGLMVQPSTAAWVFGTGALLLAGATTAYGLFVAYYQEKPL
jgi:hypothetical protein